MGKEFIKKKNRNGERMKLITKRLFEAGTCVNHKNL